MSSAPLSRRSLIKTAALAGRAVAFGVPAALFPATAEAYTVPSKMDWWYQARFGMFMSVGDHVERVPAGRAGEPVKPKTKAG